MVKTTTDLSFENDILKSEKPVVLYYYDNDCIHCKITDKIVDKLAMSFNKDISFFKASCNDSKTYAKKFNIKSTPLIMFFNSGIEVCSRISGYITMKDIRDIIENVHGGVCKSMGRSIIKCDTLILGGGPAGLTSAIYAARAKLITAVLETNITGGQVATTYEIANYPGSNGIVKGYELIENMKSQAKGFGAQIDELKTIREIDLTKKIKRVLTDDTEYFAKSVIIATGATPRRLSAKGENKFRGKGIHYCATCDAALYPDSELVVIGGGNSAVEESVFLTKYANHITLVHHLDRFQATFSAIKDFEKHTDIDVLWNSEVIELKGSNFLETVIIKNFKTGTIKEINADGVFVYIGWEPNSKMFKDILKLDKHGYIITDENMGTSLEGVYAAGDVRQKPVKQVSTATGDGTIAGIMVEKYINRA
jgi:thioredoxin reductase (NADPH)